MALQRDVSGPEWLSYSLKVAEKVGSVCGQVSFKKRGRLCQKRKADRGDAYSGQLLSADPVFGLEVGVGFPRSLLSLVNILFC